MKFPLSELDRQKYFENIFELFNDKDCYVFIDTNIIGLLYKFHYSARKEFFDWMASLIENKQIKTPQWAIYEYTNRFINNQLEDYLSAIKKVSSIQKDFAELSSFLRMNTEAANLSGTGYQNIEQFEEDLKLLDIKLKAIAAFAKTKDEKYKLKIHEEIRNYFEKTVIDSNLELITNAVSAHGEFRYKHRIPPGYGDNQKDVNVFGDLVIWREILECCKSNDIKRAILITNDGKKDWVYAPNKVLENGRTAPNNGKIRIADPRLINEFRLFTNSEEFYIVNFDLLIQIFILNNQTNFNQLSKALQIVHQQKYQDAGDSENSFDNSSEKSSYVAEFNSEDKTTSIKNTFPNNSYEYSSAALADSKFLLEDGTFGSDLITRLKSYNWYVQNPALESFLEYDFKTIENNQLNIDKLFVIGRNIYQAACGSAAVAVDFLINLDYYFYHINYFVFTHLYNGMFYEVYFDSNNNFRNALKANFISELLAIKNSDCLNKLLIFINQKLKGFEKYLVFIPGGTEKVDLKMNFEDNFKTSEDWLTGQVYKHRVLKLLEVNGKSLLSRNQNDYLDIYYSEYSIEKFIELICRNYAIPKDFIVFERDQLQEETTTIEFGSKKLRKLNTL